MSKSLALTAMMTAGTFLTSCVEAPKQVEASLVDDKA